MRKGLRPKFKLRKCHSPLIALSKTSDIFSPEQVKVKAAGAVAAKKRQRPSENDKEFD